VLDQDADLQALTERDSHSAIAQLARPLHDRHILPSPNGDLEETRRGIRVLLPAWP
jgi:hypothetical protein